VCAVCLLYLLVAELGWVVCKKAQHSLRPTLHNPKPTTPPNQPAKPTNATHPQPTKHQTRARVAAIKARLETGLRALACCADAAPAAAAAHMRDLSPLCVPLLASPVVGAAALAAVRALARCMPPPMGDRSLTLAGCLRLVVLAGSGAEGVDYSSIPERAAVADVISALERVRGGWLGSWGLVGVWVGWSLGFWVSGPGFLGVGKVCWLMLA